MNGQSLSITNEVLTQLKQLIPAAFTEEKLNLDQLKRLLGEEALTETPERYELNWVGKTEAYRTLQLPTARTLIPQPEESLNWDTAQHVLVEGDNLDVLKILQKSYHRQIKLIYIDPPYNTGLDRFIYSDRFAEKREDYLRRAGDMSAAGERVREGLFRTNRRENGRFHSNWLSMMLPRLTLARNLLHDEGLLAVSIDDNELYTLKLLLDEVFGEENYRNTIFVRRYDKNINTQFVGEGLKSFNTGAEYVLIYSRNEATRLNPVYREASEDRKAVGYWKGFWNDADRPTMRYELLGVTISTGQWKWKQETADEAVANYLDYQEKYAASMSLEEYWRTTGSTKKFIRRNPAGAGMNRGVEHWIPPTDKILRNTLWQDIFASRQEKTNAVPFNNPKNPDLIALLLDMAFGDDTNGLVMDFFAGSGSTFQAVIDYNARNKRQLQAIGVQLPEQIEANTDAYREGYRVISDITRKRIRTAIQNTGDGQTGYRCFKTGESNFPAWRSELIRSENDLIVALNGLLSGETPAHEEALLWELLLKKGYSLTQCVTVESINNRCFFFTTDSRTAIILNAVEPDDIAEVIRRKPASLVIRESAFASDAHKLNVLLQLDEAGIDVETV